MSALSIFTQKLSTAHRVLQEHGLRGITTVVWEKTDLHLRLFAARNTKSVTLDGCTFDLKPLPAAPMKLSLIELKYEGVERRTAREYVNPEIPVIELGGCIGVVACITNRLLKNPKQHVVVEANPQAIPLIEGNRRHNRCEFEVINAAIAYGQDSVAFTVMKELSANSASPKNGQATIQVPAVTLRSIADGRGIDSFTLICDIEGYEYDLILNEADVLKRAETIILETHERLIGGEKMATMISTLQELGFRTVEEESFVMVMKKVRLPA